MARAHAFLNPETPPSRWFFCGLQARSLSLVKAGEREPAMAFLVCACARTCSDVMTSPPKAHAAVVCVCVCWLLHCRSSKLPAVLEASVLAAQKLRQLRGVVLFREKEKVSRALQILLL